MFRLNFENRKFGMLLQTLRQPAMLW